MSSKNVLVAQSGGPTAVINSSLLGIIDGCRNFPDRFNRIYAGYHGIEGILNERLLNLSAQSDEELRLLQNTPAAGAIGTCRYKVKPWQEEDMSRIVSVLDAHNIAYFFYIGGNDSMDTINRVSNLTKERGSSVMCVGVPKTIDNDLGDQQRELIDHTPGYGSTARYWAYMIQNLNEENRGSCPSDPVLVVQAMGRKIGFIPAAARLADPQREMPLQLYLAESSLGLNELGNNVADAVRRHGRVIVVISEGFDVGDLGEQKDSFGHAEFGTAKRSVAQAVAGYINDKDILPRGSARGQVPGTDQRHAAIYASTVDLEEAYGVGKHAVEIGLKLGTGYMATIVRKSDSPYAISYGDAKLNDMANSERTFPKEWLSENKIDTTDDFVEYARPLIGEGWPEVPISDGLQRYARLEPVFAEQKCEKYALQAYRERGNE